MFSKKYLIECFKYNPDTGILTWRFRPRHHFKTDSQFKRINRRHAGTLAGSIKPPENYCMVQISGKKISAHRIIWMMIHGYWPKEIDHINHRGSDNRFSNLREVVHATNSKNRKLYKNNSTGLTGVLWNKALQKWHVQIQVDQERKHLGLYEDWFDAVCARKSANNRYQFHENHGRALA